MWGNMKERVHLEDVGIDGRIILKWFPRGGLGPCTGFIWLGIGTNVGLRDRNNECFAP